MPRAVDVVSGFARGLAGAGSAFPTLPGDWRGLVVFCAGTAWDGNRFPDQHMAERLARYAPLLYVDPALSPMAARHDPSVAGAIVGPRLRVIGDRLARLTPVVPPGPGRPYLRDAAEAIVRRSIGRAVKALGDDVHAIVSACPLDLFGACRARTKVLYGTDDFAAGAALIGIGAEWVAGRQAKALAAADLVVVVSEHLADSWRTATRQPVVIENGVDDKLFAATDDAPLAPDVTLPPPIAGFVGHLSERIDLSCLEAVADRGSSLLLVGPRQETFDIARMDGLLARPNVQWVGPKPFEALPSYVRHFTVGLLPYTASEFNLASFPLKVLEYLAAGRAAVVTDLPAVRTLGDVVRVAKGPAEFADAVAEELAAPPDAAAVEARRKAAADRSWDRAAERFAELLETNVR